MFNSLLLTISGVVVICLLLLTHDVFMGALVTLKHISNFRHAIPVLQPRYVCLCTNMAVLSFNNTSSGSSVRKETSTVATKLPTRCFLQSSYCKIAAGHRGWVDKLGESRELFAGSFSCATERTLSLWVRTPFTGLVTHGKRPQLTSPSPL